MIFLNKIVLLKKKIHLKYSKNKQIMKLLINYKFNKFKNI